VIIAPTPAAGQFIGSNLLGTHPAEPAGSSVAEAPMKEEVP
jgi:hypothetical protein